MMEIVNRADASNKQVSSEEQQPHIALRAQLPFRTQTLTTYNIYSIPHYPRTDRQHRQSILQPQPPIKNYIVP